MGMTDDELVAAFEAGTIEGSDFPHEAHVRVTWALVQRDGREHALETVERGIRAMAERAGRPQVFHLTITRAWFELIAGSLGPDETPELADRGLLGRFYSPAALAAGRETWIEPDLAPLQLPRAPLATVDAAR